MAPVRDGGRLPVRDGDRFELRRQRHAHIYFNALASRSRRIRGNAVGGRRGLQFRETVEVPGETVVVEKEVIKDRRWYPARPSP